MPPVVKLSKSDSLIMDNADELILLSTYSCVATGLSAMYIFPPFAVFIFAESVISSTESLSNENCPLRYLPLVLTESVPIVSDPLNVLSAFT
jgi:hypothetical protein